MADVPERLLENAIRRPSGDQAGSTAKNPPLGDEAPPSSRVSLRWRLPSAFIPQIA
jgi:hypothetical protein